MHIFGLHKVTDPRQPSLLRCSTLPFATEQDDVWMPPVGCSPKRALEANDVGFISTDGADEDFDWEEARSNVLGLAGRYDLLIHVANMAEAMRTL